MARIKFQEIVKVFTTIVLANLLFALFLFPWVTKEDIKNLPEESTEKFLALFFMGVAAFATIGFGQFGDIQIISRRLKIITTVYILLAISGAASFFFDF